MKFLKTLISLLIVTYSISAQLIGPKIVLDKSEFDFGTIVEGAIVTEEFFILNDGDSNLEIQGVSASCGCTVAKPQDDILEPGESTVLKVTFNSKNKHGDRTNYVTIRSNDKNNSNYKIVTKAKVLLREEQGDEIKNAPIISISKLNHNFGTVKEGSVLEVDVKVNNLGKSDLKIERVRSSCGCTAALMSEDIIKAGNSGDLKIELDTSNMSGKRTRTVSISTNDPVNPRLILTLFVNVEG